MKGNNFVKKAFTLAEVLITLAILGFVASVTLPALIANVQLQELQAQFKRTFLDLNEFASYFQIEHNETVPIYTARYGGTTFYNEYKKYMMNTANISDTSVWNIANQGLESPFKYHSLTSSLGSDSTGGICDASVYMMDGLGRVIFFDDAPKKGYNGPRICVDINGVKKPNTWGIDVFSFLFTVDGKVIPEGKPHASSNHYNAEDADASKNIGAAWQAQTTTGAPSCYNHANGQTCAYYAQKNENPKNPNEEYWKHFIGQKQYLNK